MCFVITCNHAKDRHEYIRKHLNSIFGQSWRVVFAPDFRLLQRITDRQAKQLSLTLAYIQVLSTALFEGKDRILIMEDDVSFTEGSIELIEAMQNELPPDFDLCYLTKIEANGGARVLPYSDNLSRIVSNWWETPITFWSRTFAEDFLRYADWKLSNGHIGNIDHELMKLVEAISGWKDQRAYKFFGSKHLTVQGLSTVQDGFDSLI